MNLNFCFKKKKKVLTFQLRFFKWFVFTENHIFFVKLQMLVMISNAWLVIDWGNFLRHKHYTRSHQLLFKASLQDHKNNLSTSSDCVPLTWSYYSIKIGGGLFSVFNMERPEIDSTTWPWETNIWKIKVSCISKGCSTLFWTNLQSFLRR